MLTRLYDLLSSWRLSVVLMVSGALYYIFLAIWGARSPAQVVQTIAGMSPFILLYVLLLTNTLFCFLRRIRGYLTLLSPSAVFLPSVAQWIHFFPDVPPLSDIPELEGETRVQIRNRFAPLGTLLLHGSLFILATGFLLSHLTRFEGKFSAGQGESLSVGPGNYDSLSPPAPLRRSLPAFECSVVSIHPEFWENELLFTRFVSSVKINGRLRSVAINNPAFLSPFTSIRLSSFGYAPVYLLAARGSRLPVEQGAVKVTIFPPGQVGHFQTQTFPHTFYLRLYPDYVEAKEGPSTKSMRISNPRFLVEIYRGKIFLKKQLVKLGESIDVEELSIAFLEILPTAEYTVVSDVGIPIIFLAFLLMLAGLILRLPGTRREISVTLRDGRWEVRGYNHRELKP